MFNIWDKIKIKNNLKSWKKYGKVLCYDEIVEYSGMTATVIELVGNDIITDIDPSVILSEQMVDVVKRVEIVPEESWFAENIPQGHTPTATAVAVRWAKEEMLKKYAEFQSTIGKLIDSDRELYFTLMNDKLRSLLLEFYGW